MRLVICGNGFDLHHKLKTSYGCYKEYLQNKKKKNIETFEFLVGFHDEKIDMWKDIEESLNINWRKFFEKELSKPRTQNEVYELTHDESILHFISGLEILIRALDDAMTDFTGKDLYEWFSSIDISKAIPDLPLNPNDKYITFNYLETLEQLYSVPTGNVFHIHGDIGRLDYLSDEMKRKREELIKDQISNPDCYLDEELEDIYSDIDQECRELMSTEIRSVLQFGAAVSDLKQVIDEIFDWYKGDEGYEEYLGRSALSIDHLISICSKNPSQNFDVLRRWLANLTGVDEIVIMGHSLNSVDNEYYSKILVPAFRNKKWIFYRHSDEDNSNITNFIKTMKITDYDVIDW